MPKKITNLTGDTKPNIERIFLNFQHQFQELIIGKGSPKHAVQDGRSFVKVNGRIDEVLNRYISRALYYNKQTSICYVEILQSKDVVNIEYQVK